MDKKMIKFHRDRFEKTKKEMGRSLVSVVDVTEDTSTGTTLIVLSDCLTTHQDIFFFKDGQIFDIYKKKFTEDTIDSLKHLRYLDALEDLLLMR